jgi:hypothetical protein
LNILNFYKFFIKVKKVILFYALNVFCSYWIVLVEFIFLSGIVGHSGVFWSKK